MIILDNIMVSFSESTILKNVSMHIKPGERIAVMGASGEGKTTLLKVMAGLIKPESGTVTVNTEKTSVVFQEHRLLPWRTAAENVNIVLGDSPATMSKAREILNAFELNEDSNKYPDELSGGMNQRVALARAIAYEPELILMDEPFKALDEKTRNRIIQLVDEKCKGKTVVLVTHDRQEAEALKCRITEFHDLNG